ncbi:MAG TPA: phosphatidylinositol-specific phospholipase C/glycerophosphodiester phosphodiesterase family protein [Candidatus Hydrogenedens sp.]|nr:phosphatidylinositol-specific phospholipase C/glycerophosphodiester phosphodiesterase family protein [Candidatus Hydrogenedens sp.]HOK08541.1 phosphatidylinositol-specific phospholipase C/glycerophosphodiester phosphodiesterase family protein [Candidatus Hydrogenedens sp.]HOL19029.1 phosphatidylinositol-specific phospholipase C/glycerophosphodiester phosphodiesterase family protein [Candidatus Hydrogenedens sp.]HPP57789.1 phosphatidylinositol-specific phospholipase C/glycerophosphodiester pho
MKSPFNKIILLLFIVSVNVISAFTDDKITPLNRAHSHNDYLRKQPLFEALNNGFCSVEADIHLVNGDLLVAHDLDKCTAERNLQDMYLKPLFELVEKNQGYVYSTASDFWLLIDFKGQPDETYLVLKEQLKPYKSYLTRIENGKKIKGAVTIVISGAVPREAIIKDENRYVFIDGRVGDLEKNPSVDIIPWISHSWFEIFSWLGIGEMPEKERAKLKEIVSKAHQQGRKIRFWGAPQTEACWDILYNEGVDFLNTDFPNRLSEFLKNKMK